MASTWARWGRVATPLAGEFGDGALNPINTAGLAGMALGSVGMGWLGDRIGRKRSYIACVALLFIGSLLCYFATSLTQLWLFRGLTGLGLGGVTPLAATLMSEWAPKRVRSIAVAAVVVAVPLGAALAGPVERMIVPEYGWRSMFLVGAIAPLVLFAIFAFMLPESPKYMARHPSQHPRLARALNRLVGEKRFDGTEQFVVEEGSAHSSNWFATIWNKQYAMATLFIWIAFAMNSFVLYVFTNYLQRILGKAQLPANLASSAADLFFYGAFFGSIGGAVLIGYLGSRLVGTGLALLGVGTAAALGMVLAAGHVVGDAAHALPVRGHGRKRHAGVHVCRRGQCLSHRGARFCSGCCADCLAHRRNPESHGLRLVFRGWYGAPRRSLPVVRCRLRGRHDHQLLPDPAAHSARRQVAPGLL